jgi:uncharacterized membrane protein YbaN (DUF454 family)
VTYIVSEFLVVVAALALLFLIGMCVVIFVVLSAECIKWSTQRFKQVTQRTRLSLPVVSSLPFQDTNRDDPAQAKI